MLGRGGMKEVLVHTHTRENMLAVLVSLPGGKSILLQRNGNDAVSKTLERLKKKLTPKSSNRGKKGGTPHSNTAKASNNSSSGSQGGVTVMLDFGEDDTNQAALVTGNNMHINEEVVPIRNNVPMVHSLRVRGFPMVGSPLIPVVNLENCRHCHVSWYRTARKMTDVKPMEMDLLGQLSQCQVDEAADTLVASQQRIYTPTSEDVGHRILCVCTPYSRIGGVGLPVTTLVGADDSINRADETELVNSRTVQPMAIAPIIAQREEFCSSHVLFQGMFRVVTYNLLVDMFCDSEWAREHLYPYLSPLHSKVNFRHRILAEELSVYHGDIMCLQEVGYSEFHECLEPRLDMHKIHGVYANKVTDVAWGMATFFRRKRWSLLDSLRVNLTTVWERFPTLNSIVKGNKSLEDAMRKSTTVGLITLLRCADGNHHVVGEKLCVVNCHLFSHPLAPHVRLLQMATLLETVHDMYGESMPILICGDFNSLETDAAIRFIKNGKISRDDPVWAEGACLGLFRHESRAAREANWHNVLRTNDVMTARILFVKLMSGTEDAEAQQQSTAAEEQDCTGSKRDERSLCRDALLSFFGDKAPENIMEHFPEASMSYEQYFCALAMYKLHDKPSFVQMMEAARELGKFSVGEEMECVEMMGEGPLFEDNSMFGHGTTCAELVHPYKFVLASKHPTYCAGTSPHPSQVDYVFYTNSQLQLCEEQPPEVKADDIKDGIPSQMLPSDHVASVLDMGWKVYDP